MEIQSLIEIDQKVRKNIFYNGAIFYVILRHEPTKALPVGILYSQKNIPMLVHVDEEYKFSEILKDMIETTTKQNKGLKNVKITDSGYVIGEVVGLDRAAYVASDIKGSMTRIDLDEKIKQIQKEITELKNKLVIK